MLMMMLVIVLVIVLVILLVIVFVMMPVMMPVMMMVVPMGGGFDFLDMAMFAVAHLAFGFDFDGHVGDAMLAQFFTDAFFDILSGRIGDGVQRGVVTLPVHAPNMDVVDVDDALDFAQMFGDLLGIQPVRRAL